MKARFIKQTTSFCGAIQRLYRLEDGSHVVVSALNAPCGPETYIFEADAQGNITNWTELDGSFRGGLDHQAALTNAGHQLEDDN
jgi:hypothetical protein